MQFNDTTTYDGLVQHYENWTRQPLGTVSGNTTLLKAFTSDINSFAFPKLLPTLLLYNDQVRWDDLNNTDAPIGYVNIVANQPDYKVTVDDNSYDILNITKVRVYLSSSSTQYVELDRMLLDDDRVANAMSPNSTETGSPQYFLENGNTLYLYPAPNYSATSGIEIFFGRQQQYFVYTDTTKEPGIPLPAHVLLALYAAQKWNALNRTDDTNLHRLLAAEIALQERNFKDFIALRNPSRSRLTPYPISFR